MKHFMSYKPEKYDNFGIHKSLEYPSCAALRTSNIKTIIDRALENYEMEEISDSKGAYYYYLSRFMDNLNWYKDSIFKFWTLQFAPHPYNELLFVQNVETKMVDNIIPLDLFLKIRNRIIDDKNAFIAHRHAIQRAKIRIYELYNKNSFFIENWLLNQVNKNKNSKPCHPSKKYNAIQLLNHNFQKCTYRMDNCGRVYVIVNHKIMTVHWNESERFV